jgi:hypothetical protein
VPKDPKRNIQNYQLRGGHLNEFEFQKSQSEIAEDSELPVTENTDKPTPTQEMERIAEVTAEAHREVEKRKKRGLVKVGGRKSIVSAKRSAKKVASKSAKKDTTRAGTKKRAGAAGKRSAQKVVRRSAKKGSRSAGKKKRATVKSRRQRAVPNR